MKALLHLCLLLGLAACASPQPYDYSEWLAAPPRSILVLPPLDQTVETEACYGCLSTLTVPLAEQGFYVFPVAVVDAMMRENGLPTAHDMHAVSLDKLREIFNPDAVLYLTVTEWGTSYQVVASTSTVAMSGRLVDAATGTVLWQGENRLSEGSGGGGGSLIGILTSALVNQVSSSISDPSRPISAVTASQMISNDGLGFLPGPYHPEHEARLGRLRTQAREAASASAAGAGDR